MLVSFGALAAGSSAAADEPSRVPEEVAEYFSTALIPRLGDLYGPGVGGAAGIDFDDSTTTVGPISRVMVWTEDFRAGVDTNLAVELSNTWVASITSSEPAGEAATDAAASGSSAASESAAPSDAAAEVVQLGLATVWISPYTNLPELANFVPSADIGPAIARAPEGSMLVHDEEKDAWYALAGDQLTPLAQGGEAIPGPAIPLDTAQQTLWQELETLPQSGANNGFVIAGLTLAFVVVLLAIFVLVPDRRHAALDPELALGFGPYDPRT
jgi:hypothetical protein